MTIRAVLASCLSLAVLACGAHVSPRAGGVATLDPGPLLPPSAWPLDVQWRQHVTARWPTGEQGFDAVLLKRGDTLELLGLSPIGAVGFVLRLDAEGHVALDNRTGEALPFAPEHILADVQRVFFPWLEPVPRGFDGEREGHAHGLSLHERHAAGQLVSRRFVRDDAPEAGSVHITYEGWRPGQDAPARVVLESEWFDYTLIIETLEQTRL